MSERWEIGDGRAVLYRGDCMDVMAELGAESLDSIVTDPPYGLSFMGKGWDHGAPGAEYWTEALRIAKPGAYLLAFGGTRTFHRLTCSIEDAGWEIRDCLMWVYGSGFPKSLDVAKATESEAWKGWGTALKPAWEPIIMARKPLDTTVASNVLRHGTGGINVDGCRVGTEDEWNDVKVKPSDSIGTFKTGHRTISQHAGGRWPANLVHDGSPEVLARFPDTKSGKQAEGGHVRNSDKTRNAYGDFDGQRCDGDVLYGDSGSAARFFYCAKPARSERDAGTHELEPQKQDETRSEGDAGGDNPRNRGAAKRGNFHPTVKPVDLMRWLVRLVTPPAGATLDPFAGSGTTGLAAHRERMRFIGIEREPEYFEIAKTRIDQECRQIGLDLR